MTEFKQVLVPDIGNFKDVEIIEMMVKVGDSVQAEDALVTLETDKATMDVPSPFSGVVKELKVKVGDKVSEGALIALIEASGESIQIPPSPPLPKWETTDVPTIPVFAPTTLPPASAPQTPAPAATAIPHFAPARGTLVGTPLLHSDPSADKGGLGGISAHASPSIRRFARELGVNLPQVIGSGIKNRVTKEDVQNFVKAALAQPRGTGGLQVAEMPIIDFAKFGAIESKPLSRIKKLSGAYLHRNWISIPHITQHDEADITDMEAFRKQLGTEYAEQGIKITPLAFLLRAVAEALQQFPDFNASLDANGENLILKKYFHIGVAVDTPGRAGGAGDARREPERYRAAGKRTGRNQRTCAREKNLRCRNAGRLFHHFQPGRHWRHGIHAYHQCAGSGDSGRFQIKHEAGMAGR